MLLAVCALVGAGCGSSDSTQGPATHLVVTRDFGAAELSPSESVAATNGLTALRQLETGHKVVTGYGGRYVKSIDDHAEDSDNSWLFYVDGIESRVGATSTRLKPGQTVQWDFHPWQGVQTGGAIVGAYPQPLKTHGARLICAPRRSAACATAEDGLRTAGVVIDKRSPNRVIVGAWSDIEGFDGVPDLTADGASNGAFAQFSNDGSTLTPFQADGSETKALKKDVGLLAASAKTQAVSWLVTGTNATGVTDAAAMLGSGKQILKNHFAIAIADRKIEILPKGAGE
jgi:hypothetical protein